MTLETQIPRTVITGNGTRGPYSLVDEYSQAIRFVSTSQVRLRRFSSTTDEVGDALIETTDYTISGSQDARTFTLTNAQAVLTSSERIVADRNQSYTQDLDLTTGGAFNASAIESRLDKHLEYLQELKTSVARKLEASPLDLTPSTMPLKANASSGDLLAYDSDKNLTPVTPADIGITPLLLGAGWVPPLGAPLGDGWTDAFADDFAEQTGSVDPLDHGAMGDCVKGSDGVATATDATFTSATLNATSSDVGKVFIAHGAGTGGAPLVTTIASINSATSIELATPAVTTVASGCVWTKSTDDTAALETAAAAAVVANLWLDLRGRSYGVAQYDMPKNLKMRDGTFVDLAPATSSRKTLQHVGDGTGFIWLENIVVDRNGGSTSTTVFVNQGIRLTSLESARLYNVEVYGNDGGECIKLDTIDDVEIHASVHDARYVHSSQVDDTVEGIVFDACGKVWGYAHVESLGRTDLTSASRDRFSRGVTISRVAYLALDVNVSRVDQGVDVSGFGPSSGSISGTIKYCASNGMKLANAQHGFSISTLEISQCGLCGVSIGGVKPDETDFTTWTQNNLVTGLSIRNIGTNQLWLSNNRSGVYVTRESAISPANTFPRGIAVTGNLIFCDRGSSTFSASGSVLTLTQENGIPIETGVRVQLTNSGGALPTGFSAGTDYYLIYVPGTLTFKLASSHINALDGTAITTTGAGTGTHTVTIQQDMLYKVSYGDLVEDTDYPNVAFNNPGEGPTAGEYEGSAPPALVIQEVAQTGQLQGFKNRLINGGFICAQRTAASNADDTYSPLDRWYALTQSNAIAVTQLSNPENQSPNGARLTQSNASAQRIGLAQIIESINCRDLRGRRAVLSARVRTSDGGTVRYAILEWTGTADAVTSDVVADWTSSSYTAGGFFNSTTLTVVAAGSVTTSANTWRSIDAIFGSVSSSCNNLIVIMWSSATMAQNATLDFGRIQLEPDRKATAFEHRSYQAELILCQRYFEAGGGNAGPYWSGNTTSGEGYISTSAFKVVKRANPTVTLTNVANTGFGSTPGTATANIYGVSENRGATATDTARLYNSTYVADAEL